MFNTTPGKEHEQSVINGEANQNATATTTNPLSGYIAQLACWSPSNVPHLSRDGSEEDNNVLILFLH
jgi:hypothetical protein